MDGRTMGAAVVAALLVGATLGAAGSGLVTNPLGPEDSTTDPTTNPGTSPIDSTDEPALEPFASDAELQAYLSGGGGSLSVAQSARLGGTEVAVDRATVDDAADGDAGGSMPAGGADGGEMIESEAGTGTAVDPSRHSETNVQVAGLDEPDRLKNDGGTAYYANHRFRSGTEETSVLDLSDPANPEPVAAIPATGDLLLAGETLIVLEGDRAWGYDVSDPSDPQRVWDERLEANVETARLHADGSLYLVLVDRPRAGPGPCPIVPYGDAEIACTDVLRPAVDSDADAVYTAARIDPETGTLEDSTSVVGSTRHSATYVSESAIYLSYTRSTSEYEIVSSYLRGPGSDHLDAETRERLETLESYDLSERAKQVEFQTILEQYREGLEADERADVDRALEEGLRAYVEERHRDLSKTGIVRVSIEGDLEATASGEVPGVPLNQFSMDEHEEHLRIATTIPRAHGVDSVNDVYVLDSNLAITGEVQGLGVDERIYSVRFQGDEGHVVTFREIDPFYTLDLSDPTDPRVEGELKLPGFSEYLHPLGEDVVLGIGQEDREVKATLFDVSDREDPTVLDDVVLEGEHYSAVARSHTAFLQDDRHEAFFLPGSEDSYVFSYADGDLEEVARVDVGGPNARAMYVGDYLYVFGESTVVVLDETTWEEQTRVDL